MLKKTSAGLLLYRVRDKRLQVLLVHPGGPFWKNKDLGAWSIPKGEFEEGEDPLRSAIRELQEETGICIDDAADFIELGSVKQSGGKIVYAWAIEADCDAANIKSNTFAMEWPPQSGKQTEFPEVDRAEWFDVETAKAKINKAQVALIERLNDSFHNDRD